MHSSNRILRDTEGTVSLVDASGLVPGLKFKRGLNKWHLATKDCESFYSAPEEVPDSLTTTMRPYMFPPTDEEAAKFHLDRCMRVLPHLQDTGGFFVAVLEKNAPCPWENKKKYEEEETKGEEDEKNGAENGDSKKRKNDDIGGNRKAAKKPKYQGYKEDPFVYFDAGEPDPAFAEIQDYYGLSVLEQSMFLTRCKDSKKRNNLYFTSRLVRSIVESNEGREGVKIVNTGVKGFTKAENKGATCDFRLAQEGSLMTIPFMSKRMVKPTRDDLEVLLLTNDMEPPRKLEEMDEKTQAQLAELKTGCIALVYTGKDSRKCN